MEDSYEKRWAELMKKDVAKAREAYPDGIKCHFCKEDNNFADDCGWFYIVDPKEKEIRNESNGLLRNNLYPACKACYNKHSWKHIQLYGQGDR